MPEFRQHPTWSAERMKRRSASVWGSCALSVAGAGASAASTAGPGADTAASFLCTSVAPARIRSQPQPNANSAPNDYMAQSTTTVQISQPGSHCICKGAGKLRCQMPANSSN